MLFDGGMKLMVPSLSSLHLNVLLEMDNIPELMLDCESCEMAVDTSLLRY